MAAGPGGPGRRPGVEQEEIGRLVEGLDAFEVGGLADPHGLHDPTACGKADRPHALGRLVAVQLEDVEGRMGQDVGEEGVGRVDRDADRADRRWHAGDEIGEPLGRHEARRGRVEHEAQEARAEIDRGGLGEPADLDAEAHAPGSAAAARAVRWTAIGADGPLREGSRGS